MSRAVTLAEGQSADRWNKWTCWTYKCPARWSATRQQLVQTREHMPFACPPLLQSSQWFSKICYPFSDSAVSLSQQYFNNKYASRLVSSVWLSCDHLSRYRGVISNACFYSCVAYAHVLLEKTTTATVFETTTGNPSLTSTRHAWKTSKNL